MERALARVAGVALLALAAATAAWSATPTHPYRAAPTRSCLTRHGAHLKPRRDKHLEPNQLEWVLANPDVTIVMRFLPNPTRAVAYEKITRHTFQVIGLSSTWIRQHLTRRRNVVIEKDNVRYALTARQIRKIAGCLRG